MIRSLICLGCLLALSSTFLFAEEASTEDFENGFDHARPVRTHQDWFYEQVDRDTVVPRTFEVYQGVMKDADAAFINAKVVAQPGDVIILAPGDYTVNLWVFTEGVIVQTADDADSLAAIHGSLEIDADRVTLERLAVVDSEAHGIEINRERVRVVTIRGCRSENNAWIGIHLMSAPNFSTRSAAATRSCAGVSRGCFNFMRNRETFSNVPHWLTNRRRASAQPTTRAILHLQKRGGRHQVTARLAFSSRATCPADSARSGRTR